MDGALKASVRELLPRGRTLSDEVFESRHRALLIVLIGHAVGLAIFGAVQGYGVRHSILEGSLVGAFAVLGIWAKSRKLRATFVSIGLLTSSAMLVHFTNGLTESHFHFFVMISLLTLYEDWFPFLLAFGYVVLHHGLAGALHPQGVFGNPDALVHPWKWAGIHALFVSAAGVANIVSWGLNEQTRRDLRDSEGRLAAAEKVAMLGNWEWDLETDEVIWSEELYRMYGLDPAEFTPTFESFAERIVPAEREYVQGVIAEALQRGRGFEYEYQLIHADGSIRVGQARGELVVDERSEPSRLFGTVLDITARKQAEAEAERSREQLAHLAMHDALTNLPNRTLLADRLRHALARSVRGEAMHAVVFLDLDNFKIVNDSLGHAVGDELLCAAATRLQSALRPGDTVARFGGDEFVVLCEDLADERAAIAIAQRIGTAFRLPVEAGGRQHFLTFSCGVAIGGADATTDTLLRDADAAMYRAKERGRARYELFDEEMRDRAVERLRLEHDLRRALDKEEFRLHYQPIVDITTGAIVAAEALIRWQDPARGLVPPAEFIPTAEESGLICDIGAWVLREACRQGARWAEQCPGQVPLRVSVNLSGRQVSDPSIVETVRSALDESGLDPALLGLELTESLLMEQAGSPADTLASLKALGVRLLLDDFGTGYSSLGYLASFPIDTLKLDRSFVTGMADNKAKAGILAAVSTMAQTLELEVIAEGIETEEQRLHLERLGCRIGQGYLFSRAVPPAMLGAALRRGRLESVVEELAEFA